MTNRINIAGCSAHGCVIRKPEGAGTNGGCQCIKDVPFKVRVFVATLKDLAEKLEAENAELRAELERRAR